MDQSRILRWWGLAEGVEDGLNAEGGTADDAVGGTVVDGEAVAVDDVSVGEDDVAEEALEFIGGEGLHDGVDGAGEDAGGIFEIEKESAETVAALFVGAVVDFEPAGVGTDGRSAGADALAVPGVGAGHGEAFVLAPVKEIGGAGDPDEVAAKAGTAGAVEGPEFAVDFFGEEGAVFVVWRNDEAVVFEGFPVGGGGHADGDAGGGDDGVGEVIDVVDEGDAGVFEAEGFQGAAADEGGSGVGVEVNGVIAPGEAEVGEGGEVGAALVGEDAGIGGEEIGVIVAEADDFDAAFGLGVEDGGADPVFFLNGAFSDAEEEAGFALVSEGTGIEEAFDSEVRAGGDDILRGEDGIVGETGDERIDVGLGHGRDSARG